MTELIVALDFDSLDDALTVVDDIGPEVTWYKVGKQLFTHNGAATVKALKERGKKVFLDLKFHDIPNTVAQAVRSALSIGADMVNFHASGGSQMIRTAVELCREDYPQAELIAVTVLTSMGQETLDEIGLQGTPAEVVLRLAAVAQKGGADGIVCSAHEIATVREHCGADFKLVVPGIRPAWSSSDDQKRIMTPAQAAAIGAQYIVVGRPITKSAERRDAAGKVLEELRNAK